MLAESIKVELCRSELVAGARLRLHVRGTSMIPALWPGESVRVESSNFEELRLGDVIVIARDRQLIAHRIVNLREGADGLAVITRGDARLHNDLPVLPAELIGVARAAFRFRAERAIGCRPSMAARALSWLVRRSDFARSLLGGVHYRLTTRATMIRRLCSAP